jgi:hypothetical protein
MTTVINGSGEDSSGAGLIIGVVVAIILIALFFMYGLPAMRGGEQKTTDINVTVPTPTNNGGTPPPSGGAPATQ